jgi:hypothetical protein
MLVSSYRGECVKIAANYTNSELLDLYFLEVFQLSKSSLSLSLSLPLSPSPYSFSCTEMSSESFSVYACNFFLE